MRVLAQLSVLARGDGGGVGVLLLGGGCLVSGFARYSSWAIFLATISYISSSIRFSLAVLSGILPDMTSIKKRDSNYLASTKFATEIYTG